LGTSGLHQASGTHPADKIQTATDLHWDLLESSPKLQHRGFDETGHIHDARLHLWHEQQTEGPYWYRCRSEVDVLQEPCELFEISGDEPAPLVAQAQKAVDYQSPLANYIQAAKA
jgi:hypothetical protein